MLLLFQLTFQSVLITSTERVLHFRCFAVHCQQMAAPWFKQKTSSNLQCLLHSKSVMSETGEHRQCLASTWLFKWGVTCTLQKLARHVTQVWTADSCLPSSQMSQLTIFSLGLVTSSDFGHTFSTCSIIALRIVLVFITGFEVNKLRQWGQIKFDKRDFQCLLMQVMQKLCPHGIVTGLLRSVWQMQQSSSSSGRSSGIRDDLEAISVGDKKKKKERTKLVGHVVTGVEI